MPRYTTESAKRFLEEYGYTVPDNFEYHSKNEKIRGLIDTYTGQKVNLSLNQIEYRTFKATNRRPKYTKPNELNPIGNPKKKLPGKDPEGIPNINKPFENNPEGETDKLKTPSNKKPAGKDPNGEKDINKPKDENPVGTNSPKKKKSGGDPQGIGNPNKPNEFNPIGDSIKKPPNKKKTLSGKDPNGEKDSNKPVDKNPIGEPSPKKPKDENPIGESIPEKPKDIKKKKPKTNYDF